MHFMEIASDVLSIIANITKFAMKNYVNFDLPVALTIKNFRVQTNLQYKLYYGNDEYFYDSGINFNPTADDPEIRITDEEQVDKLGSALLITIPNREEAYTVLIAPITAFQKPKNDITPSRRKIWKYEVVVELYLAHVIVKYYGDWLGPNGTPSYQKELLYSDTYQWWNNVSDQEKAIIINKIK